MRRRAAAKSADSEQWWLKYQHKGEGKERDIAKWKARLKRFLKIAESTTESGECANAKKLAEQVCCDRLWAESVIIVALCTLTTAYA